MTDQAKAQKRIPSEKQTPEQMLEELLSYRDDVINYEDPDRLLNELEDEARRAMEEMKESEPFQQYRRLAPREQSLQADHLTETPEYLVFSHARSVLAYIEQARHGSLSAGLLAEREYQAMTDVGLCRSQLAELAAAGKRAIPWRGRAIVCERPQHRKVLELFRHSSEVQTHKVLRHAQSEDALKKLLSELSKCIQASGMRCRFSKRGNVVSLIPV